jgi:hypothetical protein
VLVLVRVLALVLVPVLVFVLVLVLVLVFVLVPILHLPTTTLAAQIVPWWTDDKRVGGVNESAHMSIEPTPRFAILSSCHKPHQQLVQAVAQDMQALAPSVYISVTETKTAFAFADPVNKDYAGTMRNTEVIALAG